MNHILHFLDRAGWVTLITLVAFHLPVGVMAQETQDTGLFRHEQTVSLVQGDRVQQALIEARGSRAVAQTRALLLVSCLMFLFGGFAALWAQKNHRDPPLWFFAGFLFNVATVGVILWLNVRNRRRRRYRQGVAYWTF